MTFDADLVCEPRTQHCCMNCIYLQWAARSTYAGSGEWLHFLEIARQSCILIAGGARMVSFCLEAACTCMCRWQRLPYTPQYCRRGMSRQPLPGSATGCEQRRLPSLTRSGSLRSGDEKRPCCAPAAMERLDQNLGNPAHWGAMMFSVSPASMLLTATPHLQGMCAPSISNQTSICFQASCSIGASRAASASSSTS